jgi:putative ATP-dependent endonuclease of OLD family
MHIESVTIRNFLCFGSDRTRIDLDPALTALIGNNGSGKTAASQALQRVFGISTNERSVRVDDFHIPADENVDAAVTDRD